MEEFEHIGVWWLPEDSDNKLYGTLTFQPASGATLKVIGTFKTRDTDASETKDLDIFSFFEENTLSKVDIILGVIKRKLITLYRCIYVNVEQSFPGFAQSTFDVSYVFMGHHFEKKEDIVFDKLSINYSYLEEWMGLNNFQLGEHGVNYERPERIEVEANNVSISIASEFPRNFSIREVSLRQFTWITVKPPSELRFEDYLVLADFHIPNLLCLGTGEAIYPLSVRGKTKTIEESVEVYYAIRGFSPPSASRPKNMLFSFVNIADYFDICLRNWLEKSERLMSIYDLYFRPFYIPSMDAKTTFLLLAQALEAYHREMHDGTYLTPEEYKPIEDALVQAIPDGTDADHKQKLEGMIKYGYEFSLRKRLELILGEVLEDYAYIVEPLVGSSHKSFAQKITATRNHLTHHTKEQHSQAITGGGEMYTYTQKLKLLLQMCFLRELELPVSKVKELIANNREFQFLTR